MNNFMIRYGSPAIKLLMIPLGIVLLLFVQYECSKVVNAFP